MQLPWTPITAEQAGADWVWGRILCQGSEWDKTPTVQRDHYARWLNWVALRCYCIFKLYNSFFLFTRLIQNILLFRLLLSFVFFVSTRTSWKIPPACVQGTVCCPLVLSAELNSFYMGTEWAMLWNTMQTKGRLMGRIITTRRFVPICVCLFWLSNFYPALNFFLKPDTWLWRAAGASTSLSFCEAVAAVHTVEAPLNCEMTFSTITSVQNCCCCYCGSTHTMSVEGLE